jgi:lysophospholipase L1-like esterase
MTQRDHGVAEHTVPGRGGGPVSRRVALRRLAALGIGVTTGAAMVTACGDQNRAAAPAAAPPPLAPARPGHPASPPRAYNWKESNTRRLRTSLSDSKTRGVNHVFIGDSITAGVLGAAERPPYDALMAWPRFYRSALQAHGIRVAGTGLVPCSSGDAPLDSRWNTSSGWDASLAYTLIANGIGETATFVSDTPGTEVSVYYFGNSSGMTVSVDGGAGTDLPMDGVAHARVHTVTGLPDTVHAVEVTTTSAAYNQLVGASTQGGNGLVCHNISVCGATASGPNLAAWATTTPGYLNATLVGALSAASITPDAVYVALGGDDIQAGYQNAQIVAALTALRRQFSSSDVIFIGENQFNGYQAVWGHWLMTLHALADHLDCPLVDLYERYGEYDDAVANELMGDGAHLNAKAQADTGRAIAWLASSPP